MPETKVKKTRKPKIARQPVTSTAVIRSKKIKKTKTASVKKKTSKSPRVSSKKVSTKKIGTEAFAKEYPLMGSHLDISNSGASIEKSATMQRRQFNTKNTQWHKRTYHPFGEHEHLPHHHSFGALAVVAIIASAMFLYLGLRPDFNFQVPEVKMKQHYYSDNYGYSLDYPKPWKVSEFIVGEGEKSLESVVLQNGGQSIVIYTSREASDETLLPNSSFVTEVNGVKTVRYRDYDPATGLLLERVVIERPDGLVHELRGYGPLFERVVQSFLLEQK